MTRLDLDQGGSFCTLYSAAMKKHLRYEIAVILCLKLTLLIGIKQAFFSKEDRVPVTRVSLNDHLGLPVLALNPEDKARD